MKWLLAILIACAVVLLICGAISALASLADNHPLAAGIIFFGAIVGLIAAKIRLIL